MSIIYFILYVLFAILIIGFIIVKLFFLYGRLNMV